MISDDDLVLPGDLDMASLKTKLLLKMSDPKILTIMVLGVMLALKATNIQPFGDDVTDEDINVY